MVIHISSSKSRDKDYFFLPKTDEAHHFYQKRAAKSKKFCKIPQTLKTPTAMIKETQKQYRNKIVKAKAFFVTAKGSGADQKTANKKSPFRKTVHCFGFLIGIVKGDAPLNIYMYMYYNIIYMYI